MIEAPKTAHMRFRDQGVVLVSNVVSRETAGEWARKAIESTTDAEFFLSGIPAEGVFVPGEARAHRLDGKSRPGFREGDVGGVYRAYILDAFQVQREIPDLWRFYQNDLLDIAQTIVQREVILSPYEQSSVNVKVYAPNDEHGWHTDTNALTALLYLTDTDQRTGTVVEPLDGSEPFPLIANAGDLLIMQGRKVRHKVQPVPEDYPTRVTVPLNLYYPGDTWRPEGIDEIVYS